MTICPLVPTSPTGLRVLGTPCDLTQVVREQQVQGSDHLSGIALLGELSGDHARHHRRHARHRDQGVSGLLRDPDHRRDRGAPGVSCRCSPCKGCVSPDSTPSSRPCWTIPWPWCWRFSRRRSRPLIALLLWMRRGGPVFDRPEIVGLRGKTFRTIKFHTGLSTQVRRTLSGPLPDNVPDLATAGALSRLLFSTRLDKLPQLWDVLRGKMSLVGPRTISSDQDRQLRRVAAQPAHRQAGPHRPLGGEWQQLAGGRDPSVALLCCATGPSGSICRCSFRRCAGCCGAQKHPGRRRPLLLCLAPREVSRNGHPPGPIAEGRQGRAGHPRCSSRPAGGVAAVCHAAGQLCLLFPALGRLETRIRGSAW